jgi:hypothetical protein
VTTITLSESYIVFFAFLFYQVMTDTPSDISMPVVTRASSVRNRRTALQMVLDGAANELTDASLNDRVTRRRRIAPSSDVPLEDAPSVTPMDSNRHNGSEESVPNSIRDTAYNPTQATGRYSGRFYNADYRRRDIRVCYCDQPLAPANCSFCNGTDDGNEPCPFHHAVSCAFEGCPMIAHASCLSSYGQSFNSESWTFLCLEHAIGDATDNNGMLRWEDCTMQQKCQRLGVPFDAVVSNRAMISRLKKCNDSLHTCNVPLDVILSLQNSNPQPYPNIIKMKEGSDIATALCGRRFEVSMLQYLCKTCSCCGFTSPTHCDPFYPSASDDCGALRHSHLNMKFHDAWECNCYDVCHGQQFYSARRPTIMQCFSYLHGNRAPQDVIGCQSPNAILCNNCYFEFKQQDGEHNNLTEGESSSLHIFAD